MTTTTRVAVLVGSLREGSLNHAIAQRLQQAAPQEVEVEIAADLADLPFYDPALDDVDAVPAAARRLRELVAGADRLLLVTPEHNGNLPPLLGNAIDWLSRPYGQGAIVDKPFAVIGATPTPFGGKWAHEVARRSAGIAGARVLEDVSVSQPVIEEGALEHPEVQARLVGALLSLVAAEAVAS